jgi:hypothetical protein
VHATSDRRMPIRRSILHPGATIDRGLARFGPATAILGRPSVTWAATGTMDRRNAAGE